jgi:site-specific DNA-methyltransferase (adenine-specific)
MINKIIHGDCLQVMKDIPDKSIDMIFADLPYNETECKWDVLIPIDELWIQYERIIKDNGAIVLTGSFKFAIKLIDSNKKLFKYELIWDKVKPSNIFVGKLRPMNKHEYVLLFSKGTAANGGKNNMCYYPQMEKQKPRKSKLYGQSDLRYRKNIKSTTNIRKEKYPKSILTFSNANNKDKKHPTQKPVPLVEWCIKSFTKKNELVLDNCIGSGTTAVACINTNRNFIGIEKEKKYVDIANKRVSDAIENITQQRVDCA